MLRQAWEDFVARTTGPLNFRFFLQPAIAIVMAVLAGRRDARQGRPPFLAALVTTPALRPTLILDLLHDLRNVVLMGAVMDAVYQYLVHNGVHPLELLFTVMLLAVVPYILLRGPATRVFRRVRPPEGAGPTEERKPVPREKQRK